MKKYNINPNNIKIPEFMNPNQNNYKPTTRSRAS